MSWRRYVYLQSSIQSRSRETEPRELYLFYPIAIFQAEQFRTMTSSRGEQ